MGKNKKKERKKKTEGDLSLQISCKGGCTGKGNSEPGWMH